MQVSQAKKLKDLERENARLKKLVAEQALDKAILEEALKGKYQAPNDAARRVTTVSRCWQSLSDELAGCRDSRDRRSAARSSCAMTKTP